MRRYSETVRYKPLEDLKTGTIKNSSKFDNPESLLEKEAREMKLRLDSYRQSYNNGLSQEEAEDIALSYNRQFSRIINTLH